MKIETLKDVLHWTAELHRRLSVYLTECGDKTHNERSGLLLDFLTQHETRLAELVSRFEESADEKALRSWCYEYFEKNPQWLQPVSDLDLDRLDIQSLMARIIDQHNRVIELYRYLHSQEGAPSAKALLQNLIELEQHEAMQMAMGSNRLNDI